jgi:hypothetical protein
MGNGESVRALEGCQNRFLTPVQEGKTFRPPGCHIGERQRVDVVCLDVGATMGHQVRWKSNRVGSHSTPGTCG